MTNSLTPYLDAIMAGASINSQAKLAGVDPTALRRATLKHPGYAQARADGKLHAKGLPGAAPVDKSLVQTALADVDGGMTIQASAMKYGMPVSTLTKMFHKHNPGVKAQRGGLGTPRSTDSRIERAQATVIRCRKALEKAEKDLSGLAVSQ